VITKIRTNIFLTKIELKRLRTLSKKTGAPVAELVRRAIDEYLGRHEKREKRRWNDFSVSGNPSRKEMEKNAFSQR